MKNVTQSQLDVRALDPFLPSRQDSAFEVSLRCRMGSIFLYRRNVPLHGISVRAIYDNESGHLSAVLWFARLPTHARGACQIDSGACTEPISCGLMIQSVCRIIRITVSLHRPGNRSDWQHSQGHCRYPGDPLRHEVHQEYTPDRSHCFHRKQTQCRLQV